MRADLQRHPNYQIKTILLLRIPEFFCVHLLDFIFRDIMKS